MRVDDRHQKPNRFEVAHDEAPSIITDHKFVPKKEWWSLCKICNLAQAAHAETTLRPFQYYSDGNPDEE